MQTTKTINRYFKESFSSDFKAGFITAIVALPLAITFAMAQVSNLFSDYTPP
jgi:SulP family sulfate permease